ncbi:unnamed protein product [Ectocarpus sp. 6 AP-2014]
MQRYLSVVALLLCLLTTSGTRGSSSARKISRTPMAVGALSGLRIGLEPHLLEFHGEQCDHCEAMKPLFRRLFLETRLVVKRHMVWEDTANFRLMSIYDLKSRCRGLPFFYNRRTGETICGATTWSNFKNWALDRNCKSSSPPRMTGEQQEDAKEKKLEQDPLFSRLKKGLGGDKEATPTTMDEYK